MTRSLTERRSRDAAFDLEAYLRRIGGVDCRAPDLGTLRAIVARHARAIAFENLDPFLRRLSASTRPHSAPSWCTAGRRVEAAQDDVGPEPPRFSIGRDNGAPSRATRSVLMPTTGS